MAEVRNELPGVLVPGFVAMELCQETGAHFRRKDVVKGFIRITGHISTVNHSAIKKKQKEKLMFELSQN